jgi:mRNA interferase MazF
MKYFTTTNARKNIALIINDVRENNSVVALGRRDRPDVLLLKYPEFYSRKVSDEVNFQANSKALDFLRDEPDVYFAADLKCRLTKTVSTIPRGAIVLVPFPFTDLSSIKVRPALVISGQNNAKADVAVLFLTSLVKKTTLADDVLLTSADKDFIKTGLKMTSVIKCRKIATLDRSIILGELGSLTPEMMKRVDKILKKIFFL